MSIRFRCPAGHRLRVPEKWAGRAFQCPVCKRTAVAPQPVPQPKPTRPAGRDWFRRRPQRMPPDTYQADRGHIATVRWLGGFLLLVAIFSAAPALGHLNPATAPGWARAVLALAALETVYIVWMLATPDWSTVWVVMLVFAVAAALYGMATAIAIATPPDKPMPLEMDNVRDKAAEWCGSVLMAMALATYLCGRASGRWRRTVGSRR